MPEKHTKRAPLTDEELRQLLKGVKPDYAISDEWLNSQRLRLRGALDMLDEGRGWSRLGDRLLTWWNELPDLALPLRPALIGVAALLLGLIIGQSQLMQARRGTALTATNGGQPPGSIDLSALIASGELKDIDLIPTDDPDNPVALRVETSGDFTLTGTADREDILTALQYMLVRDPNPGKRLHSARILGQAGKLEGKKSTVMALVSALISDENPGVRLSIVKSLRGIDTPLIKDAVIKAVMEDSNEAVRLAALENLAFYLDDLSVRSVLLLVSRMDPTETVRYKAYKVLSQAPELVEEERLDSQP